MITNNFPVALQQIFKGYQDTEIRVTKNDTFVNTLTIKIFNGTTEITYSQISSGTITFVKDDGNVVQGNLNINASSVSYQMGTNEIAVPGMVRCSIQLYGSDGERLTPAKFKFYVDEDLSDPTAISSTTQLLINTDIASLKERIAALENNPSGGGAPIDAYTKEETDARIQAVVEAAPEALDTLNEIADALGEDPNFSGTIISQLSGKVDKVSGKGLSTNDFTTQEKTKLAGLHAVATSGSYNDLLNKPVGGGGSVTASTINGNILVNGQEQQVYVHPNNSTTQHVTTAQISTWNGYAAQIQNLQTGADPCNALGYGIVGNDSTDNTTAINNAITALNNNGKKKLYFPAGYYRINGTISVPANFEIELDRAARIRQNHATAHAIHIKSWDYIHGGWIEMMHATASGACIYLDGDDMVIDTLISDMRLMGGHWTSMGIFCDGTNPSGTIENCYTMYPQVSNCVIRDHLYGIKCQANANAGNGGSWCTDMQCVNTQLWDNGHHIWLSKGCGGVQFSNFAMEGGEHVTEYIWTDADIGLFKNPTYYDNNNSVPVCHFGPNAVNNIFETWYNPNETNNAFPDDNPTGNNFVVYPSMVRTIAALPGASALNRGAIRLVRGGAGVADATYICRKKADGTYEWARID